MVTEVADQLQKIVDIERISLMHFEEAAVTWREIDGKWSAKEFLGHLVDSAMNNHQRFVLAQTASELSLPGYEPEIWVKANDYQHCNWISLVLLWGYLNSHLVHVIRGFSHESLTHMCTIGSDRPVSLEFLVEDYLRHLQHHLRQIHELCDATVRAHNG